MAGTTSIENGKKGGRPKGFAAIEAERAREYIVKRLKKELKPIVDKALLQAKAGDKFAREWLADRAWHKVPQAVDITSGGKPLLIADDE